MTQIKYLVLKNLSEIEERQNQIDFLQHLGKFIETEFRKRAEINIKDVTDNEYEQSKQYNKVSGGDVGSGSDDNVVL